MNLIKRAMDILISLIGFAVMSPVMIFAAICIKLDTRGPVLYKQKRLKKNGEIFTMYKFRTMIENAENMGTGLFNYRDDFRVTRVGRFLRKSSLDELPQLLNIILGDMSIVGPRPPVYYELGSYEELSGDYKRRFTVLPGITGLAQVIGRNGLQWDEKVKYDNEYIDLFNRYGILIDVKIIALTIINVFRMKNIYEEKDETAVGKSD